MIKLSLVSGLVFCVSVVASADSVRCKDFAGVVSMDGSKFAAGVTAGLEKVNRGEKVRIGFSAIPGQFQWNFLNAKVCN